jgi:cellulose synthase/poly-beta-1,6-N-acetylglucosamine synthase-like glycosyltransferase
MGSPENANGATITTDVTLGWAVALRGGAALSRSRDWFSDPGGQVIPWTGPHRSKRPSRCPELECLRENFSADVLADAEDRALRLGIGADRVLIANGTLNEETYLRAFGKHLGVTFEPLDDIPRELCPVHDNRLIESAAAGLLPLNPDGKLCLVVAPRAGAARRISELIADKPQLAGYFRFTSTERLSRFVLRCAGKTLAARATNDLKHNWPTLSAAPPRRFTNIAPLVVLCLAALAGFALAPTTALFVTEVALAAFFLAWLGLRVMAAFLVPVATDARDDPPDEALPTYSVIAALYREAASVDGLLLAIERLDYPREKLDVIVVLEADDRETREVLAARNHRIPITVMTAPAWGPRTKPKALNFALPFARGHFTVIYDAEDRPEPDQLRRALRTFHVGGDRLACVQARLCIDNTADSWLARLFTAEYAGQFDVFLPGIAAMGLPLPLGGSSNHFRTTSLRDVGGWDAYNVTEDADLGMRLARFHYRTGVITSTTYEEAPARIRPWLRQRTRWFKGWMQTWLVHMREPRRLMQNLGPAGFVGFQLIVGGNVLAALVHPLFIGGLVYAVAIGAPIWRDGSAAIDTAAALYGLTIIVGYLTSALLSWLGLLRRSLLAIAWVLALMPVHWLLLSLAAWRALFQLLVSPYVWEKTEHGLAKSSRRAANLTRSLLLLERQLSGFTQIDSDAARRATNTSATRPPPRQAAA